MRAELDALSGFPVDFPGTPALSLRTDREDGETGLVTLVGAIPFRGLPGIMRWNLFAELSGVRDHVASAIVPPTFSGFVMSVAGLLADSWHVYCQSQDPRQDCRLALAAQPCCAPHRVRVRQDLLGLALSPELAPALAGPPLVPWGENYGLHVAQHQAGTGGPVTLPQGSRLWRVTARGAAATASVTFTTPAGGSQTTVTGAGDTVIEPWGNLPVASYSWVDMTDLIVEVVR